MRADVHRSFYDILLFVDRYTAVPSVSFFVCGLLFFSHMTMPYNDTGRNVQ